LAGKSHPEGVQMPLRECYLRLLHESFIKPTTFTCTTEAYHQLGGLKLVSCGGDWDFFLRFVKQYRIAYLDRPLGVIRPGSTSTQLTNAQSGYDFVIRQLLLEREQAKRDHDQQIRAAVRRGIETQTKFLASIYLERDSRVNAAKTYLHGWQLTHSMSLLLRALSACLPKTFQRFIRKARSFVP
jgi:hypothetical protein